MTERDHVTVNDPSGPVYSGGGHQYVFYGGPDWMIRRGVEPLRIVREDRVRLADRFVRPSGYRAAAERLVKPGSVVLLEARPGSGRRAAAIMLLHELGKDGDTIEEPVRFDELPATDKDKDRGEVSFSPAEGDRYLLDLSGISGDESYAEAQHRLAVYRSQVQEADAHMVVVLPWGMAHAPVPDLEPHTVRLGRPRGVAVVTRYLRMDGMSFRSGDLRSAGLQRLFDRSPMRELARFAGLVRIARDSDRFGTDITGWCDQAMHAVADRAAEVREQMDTVRTTAERALLITTAVFEEALADTVYEAWHVLLRTVGHEEDGKATEFERTDFGASLEALGIERGPDGRIRFERLAYADAVRSYFWTNFPGVRDDLRDWIGQAAGLHGLTTDDRMNVVVRFCEGSLAVARPDHLFDLVARWADRAAGASCDPLAVRALELGLSHERCGGWFRKRMYDCVRSGPLSDGLARVLIAACVQSLASTHPDQALVRLHHLALRKGQVGLEAGEGLLGLAGRDRRLYRLLVDRLRDRTRQAEQPHLRLLTELMTSGRSPDPPSWPDLFLGWEAIFSQPPTTLWNPLVRSWLNIAAADRTRETALDVMVRATHGRTAALHRLYAIACDWASSARHPPRAAVAAVFWQHIDDAQYARTQSTEQAGAGPRTMEEA
ncbi:hypothetical protein B9W62_13690 [Streptomyces sp. CS113]|uniref:hypothetical protein n=1 Tax=Streptomyces sp. CS113 TaxID=1982761 RepID=UPI000B40EE3C|nr:hypothetical protein [Streptomyces sp. CS113]OWA08847.1 hypothetical protein B9W62_13690 [Streptomyces sp. CS113]